MSIDAASRAPECTITAAPAAAEVSGWFGLRRVWRAPAARNRAAILLLFLAGVGIAAVGSIVNRFPPPKTHDELSYLLGADTFARGRLTNPSHPMWRYFETFHVLQRPTYASKYPPAQALALAFGEVTTGQPIVGVWLSFGLMASALVWMLLAWTEGRWAIATAAAVTLSLAPTYWAISYWGGALPALGGALVYGAGRRLVSGDQRPWWLAAMLGLGLLILANSRPYEGLLVSIPMAAMLAVWLVKPHADTPRQRRLPFMLALAAVLAAGGTLMLFYNHAVTGSWFELPYMVYQRQYDPMPLFRFLPERITPRPPNPAFAGFVDWERTEAAWPFTVTGYAQRSAWVAANSSTFFLQSRILWFVFAALPLAVRRRSRLFLLGAFVFAVLGMSVSTWFAWHYAAPLLALDVALWAGCLRSVAAFRLKGVRLGRWVAACALLLLGGTGAARLAAAGYAAREAPSHRQDWAVERLSMAARLEKLGGKHLVLVTYPQNHRVTSEWVYNSADIDGAPVVWARDLGPGHNAPLLAYFRSRRLWHVTMKDDSTGITLTPASPADLTPAAPARAGQRIGSIMPARPAPSH